MAGSPRRKARRMLPSKPKSRAKGFKKSDTKFKMLSVPMLTFAIIQIRIPAGAAAMIARSGLSQNVPEQRQFAAFGKEEAPV